MEYKWKFIYLCILGDGEYEFRSFFNDLKSRLNFILGTLHEKKWINK